MTEENFPPEEETPSAPVLQIPEIKTGKKCNPLRILFLLNALLFTGLLVLYVLFFTSPKTATIYPVSLQAKQVSGSVSVACVNSDSILEHYTLVKELRQQLENAHNRKQLDIKTLKKNFDKKVADFQQKVASNILTSELAKINEKQLMDEQQKILELQDKYAGELSQKEIDLNIQLLDSVTNFLKRYNKTYQFDYILNIKKGGDVFLSNDTLDITKDVIEQLNKEYNANKK
jgi:outer membrane protein